MRLLQYELKSAHRVLELVTLKCLALNLVDTVENLLEAIL